MSSPQRRRDAGHSSKEFPAFPRSCGERWKNVVERSQAVSMSSPQRLRDARYFFEKNFSAVPRLCGETWKNVVRTSQRLLCLHRKDARTLGVLSKRILCVSATLRRDIEKS